MKKSMFTLTELIIAGIGLAAAGLVLFGIYAAIHFILKFW